MGNAKIPLIFKEIDMKKIVALFYCLSILLLVLSCDPLNSSPLNGTPAAPDELELDAVSSATMDPSIELSWRDNADNEEGYLVQRDSSEDFTDPHEFQLDADLNSYLDSTITQGQLYYYRVRAYNSAGPSSWSEIQSLSYPPLVP